MSATLNISHYRHRHHRHRHHHRRRRGTAVEGIQEAGEDLSETFARLEKRCKARRIVAAIRHCDARAVNSVLDRDCRVICFFRKPGYDCVKIGCGYGRNNSAIVSIDICVRSLDNRYTGFNGFGCF